MTNIFDLNCQSLDTLSTLFRDASRNLNRTSAGTPERTAALRSLDSISDAMCRCLA